MAQPVSSTALSAVDYDEERRTLRVSFVKGGTWTYFGVPPQVASGLRNALSKGTFFNIAIRGQYAYSRG